jgi:hypothetical protein
MKTHRETRVVIPVVMPAKFDVEIRILQDEPDRPFPTLLHERAATVTTGVAGLLVELHDLMSKYPEFTRVTVTKRERDK